ncbi:MAG TPA: hypothetical protein VES89_06390, partial [Candidatus Competibacteraceae bacterium]|nr:hypothetical protein [Candidatus Competibacteraceae bacterium]
FPPPQRQHVPPLAVTGLAQRSFAAQTASNGRVAWTIFKRREGSATMTDATAHSEAISAYSSKSSPGLRELRTLRGYFC